MKGATYDYVVPKVTAKPKLDEYRKKRDFAKTPEPPPGDPDASQRNLVFVVQQHAATRMHWDFRLEVDGVLKSWPLPNGPSLDPKVKRLAVMTEDHPYDYRNFEGVIPKGEYGGGQVIIWDEGIYTPDEDGVYSWDDKEEGSRRMLEGIERGKLSFTLQGHKLHGSFTLIKTKYEKNSWLFIKHRDEHTSERDILEDDRSVRSGLTIKDLKEGKLPNAAVTSVESHPNARAAPFPDSKKERPMLASLVDKPFDRSGWLWEPKLDGIRVLAYLRDGKVELRSRRGVDITKQYPTLVAALARLPADSMVLDGEVCALDADGVPRFQLLQPRINLTRGVDPLRVDAEQPVVFFLFDLLYVDGYDLRAVPLRERKTLLAAKALASDSLRVLSSIEGDGRDVAAGAQALGFEGVVGKRADSRYEYGQRSAAWVKYKHVMQQEFLVGGFTPGDGGRKGTFGALALAYWDEAGKLRYAGNVGSGFDDAELGAMRRALKPLETDESPFADDVQGVSFTRPAVAVEVKFAEWTKDGRLRAPVFLGVRDDIEPRNVHREEPEKASVVIQTAASSFSGEGSAPLPVDEGLVSLVDGLLGQLENPKPNFTLDVDGESLKLTNLDKPFWPAYGETPSLAKRELIRYYVKLAPLLLPHLRDRPLTLTRYPNGVDAKPFYQKHYEQPLPGFVETACIWSGSNQKADDYILCNNFQTLIWLGQLADLELHAWMSRTDPEPDSHGRGLDFETSAQTLDASSLNYPDFMVFDLDPYIYSGKEARGDEPEYNKRGWEKTLEVALSLKELLDQLKLSSFVKTSGKTGLHVYLPVLRHYDYNEIRAATQTIGRFLVQQHPKDVTLEWDTSKREGKVFFDANQNTRGKTLAAQYSPRPTPWAGVSTPIAWSELPGLDPTSLNVLTVPRRVAAQGDLWADILSHKSDLSALLAKR
jgi:bifunctional non-homologous end joining protein LigD